MNGEREFCREKLKTYTMIMMQMRRPFQYSNLISDRMLIYKTCQKSISSMTDSIALWSNIFALPDVATFPPERDDKLLLQEQQGSYTHSKFVC